MASAAILPPIGYIFSGPYLVPVPRRVLIAQIQKRVSLYYGIPIEAMTSHRRHWAISRPRQVAMYLAKQLTCASWSEIGRRFGGRDRTTVLHAARETEKRRQASAELEHDLRVLTALIEGLQ